MAVVRLTIEPCPVASPTTSPNTTQTPKPTNQSRKEAKGEPPFSHLWKGICNFFTGIFKPKEERSWEETAKRQKETIKALEASIAEKTEREKKLYALMDGLVSRGAKGFQDALAMHAEGSHTMRVEEMKLLAGLFQRHEELIGEHHRYTQAYQHLAAQFEQVKQDNGFLMRLNEDLSRRKIELEKSLIRERDKVAMYEQSWYGAGRGNSAQSSSIW